jgi:hypothetical protein
MVQNHEEAMDINKEALARIKASDRIIAVYSCLHEIAHESIRLFACILTKNREVFKDFVQMMIMQGCCT